MNRAIMVAIAAAGIALTAGCTATEQTATVRTVTPTDEATHPALSRDARLAVTRCTEALDGISASLADLVVAVADREAAPPPENYAEWDSGEVIAGTQLAELRRQADRAVADANDLCREAEIQLSADGLDAASMVGRFLVGSQMTSLEPALYRGTRESLAGPAEDFSAHGTVTLWIGELERVLGI